MKKTTQKKKTVTKRKSVFKPKGISKVVVLCVMAVVLVAGGGYYYFSQQKGANTGIPFVKPALNPNCKYNDPELCKFMNNMQVHSELSVVSKGEADGMTIETVTEVSGENKYHTVTKMNEKETANIISIGDTTYTLDYTDNKWWKQTDKASDTTQENAQDEKNNVKDAYMFKEDVEDKTVYKFVAKEPCGDKTCFKYQLVDPNETEYEIYMWFDDSEYLIRKMTYGQQGTVVNESIYSYGKINIAEPSPIKEGTPNSYMNEEVMQTDPQYNQLMKDMENQMQQYKEQMPGNEEMSY